MGEEISFDRLAVSTLCHHARLPQLRSATHQGSQCPRDAGIPTLQASYTYLKSGPVFQWVATTHRCPASKEGTGPDEWMHNLV
ncbi:hypothetical protein ARMGADRAFT_1011534 [Armillaria gallica]|uniref:Uncharacterized protein n=1 Tax=Armillaria gallica TaxID=47427 RepID=A0A2H3DHB4_ARMGA|nr:hypothetical protein ARMGADRAFT_1011534 [Armillaria gallica]